MKPLTDSDLQEVSKFMTEGLESKWASMFFSNHRRCTVLADWGQIQIQNSYLRHDPQLDNFLRDYLLKLAKEDEELSREVGSIWIMLLGNLAIQLFILWLKRRRENESNHS